MTAFNASFEILNFSKEDKDKVTNFQFKKLANGTHSKLKHQHDTQFQAN